MRFAQTSGVFRLLIQQNNDIDMENISSTVYDLIKYYKLNNS